MTTPDSKQLIAAQASIDENSTLQSLLENQNVGLLQLLSLKYIQQKIRSKFSYFIRHCQKNEEFCFKLIDIGIKCPMHEGSSQNMKNVCYIAADILTCDQDIVADLFILPEKLKPVKNDSENQSDEFQQIQENIQTDIEAQNKAPKDIKTQMLNEQQKFYKKYKNLIKLFEYIELNQAKDLDENCINYMVKSLNCLIRKKSEEFFYFFQNKQNILKLLIQLNQFSSINQFFIKILSDDQLDGQNILKIKKEIIDGALKQIRQSISKEEFIERIDFVEQLFQTNKYASEDNRTQLQKLSDVFVSKDIILYFYQILSNSKQDAEFYNSVSYLNTMMKRMNVDEQIDPYSYTNQPKQQTMLFQMDSLFKEFHTLLMKGQQILNQLNYSEPYKQKLVQNRFYEFLVCLTKNSRFSNCSIQKSKSANSQILKGNNVIVASLQQKISLLKELLKYFIIQHKSGITRNYISLLFQKILSLQIYQQKNHQILQKITSLSPQKKQNQSLESGTPAAIEPESQQKSKQDDQHEQHNSNGAQQHSEDKKSKIQKIKSGLKLNIKKFSSQSSEKQEQKKQIDSKKQKLISVKRLQESLSIEKVLNILSYFSNLLKQNNLNDQIWDNGSYKNKQTETGAFINKIIIVLSNSIIWKDIKEVDTQKQQFLRTVEKLFPLFNFKQISQTYSTTLATNTHPNQSAKSKSNPQLCFVDQFFKYYGTKINIQSPQNQNNRKNRDFNDSDFKSQQEQQDGTEVIKCSLEDLKNFTGFKFSQIKKTNSNTLSEDKQNQQINNLQQTEKCNTQKTQKPIINETQSSRQNQNQKHDINMQTLNQKVSQKPENYEKFVIILQSSQQNVQNQKNKQKGSIKNKKQITLNTQVIKEKKEKKKEQIQAKQIDQLPVLSKKQNISINFYIRHSLIYV